ncbi:MAG: right-handed parallel beta-helix repeat-containing protein, partial [Thermoplasmata archaeon]
MSDESEIDSGKVYARPLRRILFVALFGLIALMAMMVMTSEPAEAVVIAGPVTWNTPQVWAEDVTIIAGGDLTIQGTTVTMVPFFDGMWEIRVQSGGTLTVDQSTITSGSPFRYDFWIDQGSRATFIDSQIQFAGYNGPLSSMGIHVSTDAITFSGTIVTNGGMHGIYWDTPTPISALTLNGCEVAWNLGHGIYIDDSAASDYILQINSFTDIHDNGWSGVFFEQMGSKNLLVDVIDSMITNNGGSGVYVWGIAGGGDARLTVQGSDISNNFGENVIIRRVNSGLVDIRAFNSNFDFSSVGAGIYVGQVGAGGFGGISVSLDQSFVVGNGAQGIFVAGISVGDMFVDIMDTSIERNGLMFGGDGVRMAMPAPGRLVSFSALRSSFSSNLGSGIHIVEANPGDVRVGIDTCTIQTNSDMGLYVGPVVSTGSNGLQIDVVNSDLRGNGNTNGVILLGGLTNGNGWINIDNNDFNNSYAALYVASALQTTTGSGDILTITFTNNWVVSDWSEYGVRF